MRKNLLVLICTVIFCMTQLVNAQSTMDTTKFKTAMNFGIGGFPAVGIKHWFSNNHVVTGGILLSTESPITNPSNNAVFDPFADIRLGVFGRYDYYLLGRQQFAPFLGIVLNSSWRQKRLPNLLSFETNTYLGLGAGIECFILPWLSVSGLYSLGFNYTTVQDESLQGTFPATFAYLFRMNLSANAVTISIYF